MIAPANLLTPPDDSDLTVADFLDALSVVANSWGTVSGGLQQQGRPPDDADTEALSRTAAYFGIPVDLVRLASEARPSGVPFNIRTLAETLHEQGDPRVIALVRTWLAHRGKPNLLVRTYVN